MNEDYAEKPPLGCMPKWRWDELNPSPSLEDIKNRLHDINAAIIRYEAAKCPIPDDWYKELAGVE